MAFSPDVVTAVLRHMNNDHAEDCVVICRGLGGQPGTTRAVMSDVDADAAYFEATVDDLVVPVRIQFRQRLTERPQIRVEVTWMYHEACDRLGLPARPHSGPPRGDHA
jgi:Domain of unknown function (DUF2470)